MKSERPPTAIDVEVKQLVVRLEAELAARTRAAKTARWITVGLCCTVLFFVFVNFLHIRSAWTEEQFKECLAAEAEELSPVALREVHSAAEHLVPVYLSEAQSQLTDMLPEITDTVNDEIEEFSVDVVERVHERLLQSMNSFAADTERRLYASFPELRDPAVQKDFHARFERVVEESTSGALLEFEQRFRGEVDGVIDTLLAFQDERPSGTVTDLRKKFLRLWLRLLDLEVMEL
jgi:hypothetical protein